MPSPAPGAPLSRASEPGAGKTQAEGRGRPGGPGGGETNVESEPARSGQEGAAERRPLEPGQRGALSAAGGATCPAAAALHEPGGPFESPGRRRGPQPGRGAASARNFPGQDPTLAAPLSLLPRPARRGLHVPSAPAAAAGRSRHASSSASHEVRAERGGRRQRSGAGRGSRSRPRSPRPIPAPHALAAGREPGQGQEPEDVPRGRARARRAAAPACQAWCPARHPGGHLHVPSSGRLRSAPAHTLPSE